MTQSQGLGIGIGRPIEYESHYYDGLRYNEYNQTLVVSIMVILISMITIILLCVICILIGFKLGNGIRYIKREMMDKQNPQIHQV